MVTIRFTQCCTDFKLDINGVRASRLPVIPRMWFYEEILKRFPHNDFDTMDENFIIVAQWMKRQGKIDLRLISVCCCQGNSEMIIPTDTDGDMEETPHHGFFPQRLQYLR